MPSGKVALLEASLVQSVLSDRDIWVPDQTLLDAIVPGATQVKAWAVELNDDGGADIWDARPIWVDVHHRDAEVVSGVIVRSDLDRDGFREGDVITVPLSRLLDVVALNEHGSPTPNMDRSRSALGKRILVGQSSVSSSGVILRQVQFAGTITAVDDVVITIEADDGDTVTLPHDSRSIEEARPGAYRLSSTGEVVEDPDFTTTWVIHEPPTSGAKDALAGSMLAVDYLAETSWGPLVRLAGDAESVSLLRAAFERLASEGMSIYPHHLVGTVEVEMRSGRRGAIRRVSNSEFVFEGDSEQWAERAHLLDPLTRPGERFQFLDDARTGKIGVVVTTYADGSF